MGAVGAAWGHECEVRSLAGIRLKLDNNKKYNR